MSPAGAAAIEFEEPDWASRFDEHLLRFPKLEPYLARDSAFEATLKDWRNWHKASAPDGVIALAKLDIMPPRNLIKDVPRGGEPHQEQHDAHCWLTMSQRAWRITGIEDKMMLLDSFGEQTQIDLTRAKWEKHREKAIEALMALRK